MSDSQIIRGTGGRILGILYTMSNGRLELRSPNGGKILGYYEADRDTTIRPNGEVVGYGNLLMTLL